MSKNIRSFFSSSKDQESSSKKAKLETVDVSTEEVKSAPVSDVNVITLPTSSTTVESVRTEEADAAQPSENSFGWGPFDSLEPGWKSSLASEFSRPYFRTLLKFLDSEFKSQTIFPPVDQIFTAFNLCPLDQVKVPFF
jgi:hypothetical protein